MVLIALAAVILLVTPAAAGLATANSTPTGRATPPLVGFSFSPRTASYYGEDPLPALSELLRLVHPNLVRLPIYWDSVAANRQILDFSEADGLISTVEAYNAEYPNSPASVMLVVGIRNLGFPEIYAPSWIDANASVKSMVANPDYQRYLASALERYSHLAILTAWQMENEPFDNVSPTSQSDAVPTAEVASEVALAHRLDPHHPVVVTSYNNASVALDRTQVSPYWKLLAWLRHGGPQTVGHMNQALAAGDVAGLDAYVVTPSTPLATTPASQRIDWKALTLAYWSNLSSQHDKPLWVTEMQAMPWNGEPGFTTQNLLQSAKSYARRGPAVFLLWGVEYWLIQPTWLAAGEATVSELRATN